MTSHDIAVIGTGPVAAAAAIFLAHAAAAIVRPDRTVFGHTTDTLSLDGLPVELESKLCLV